MNPRERDDQGSNRPDRRRFLVTGLACGLVPTVARGDGDGTTGEGAATSTKSAAADGQGMPMRRFGKTGRVLPMLAYGGAALPKVWLNPLSIEDRVALVRYAYEKGLRYFDTAGNYLESQAILGEALEGVRRDVFLVTKVETTNPAEVRAAVEKSLRELRTDRLDAVLVHGTPGIEQMTVARAMEVHAELVKLRDEGVIAHIGLSAHGYFDKALAMIATGGFDLCMLAYGYIPRGYDQVHSARMIALRDACLARAHELDMGVAAMKVVGAGVLGAWAPYVVPGFDRGKMADLPAAAIRHVLADDRVDLLVIGMRLRPEIDANIAALAGDRAYTAQDRSLLASFAARAYESETIRKMRIE
jgi:predicted aldo/keto reductase-like oxidoreductase